jgi:hypothetical protein
MIWSFITCFTGISTSISLSAYKMMGGGFMTSCIMYSFAVRSQSTKNDFALFLTYAFLFVSTFVYLYITGNMSALDTTTDRLEGEHMNGNDIAYFLFAFIISITIAVNQSNNSTSFIRLLISVSMIILSIWCAIVTGSRQILVVVLPMTMVSSIYILSNGDKSKIGRKLFFLIIGTIITVAIFMVFFSETFVQSNLMFRMQENMQEDSRIELLRRAFRAGLSHPFLGVGTGCFGAYNRGAFSHCTYTELFANSGLIPMLAYIYMVIAFIGDQRKLFKVTKNKVFEYLIIIGVFWAIYNFFYAFHMAAWIISFFFLLIGYSENKYNQFIQDNI